MFFEEMGHSRPFSQFIFVFSAQIAITMINVVRKSLADAGVRTDILWFWKRPLYQLCHSSGPTRTGAKELEGGHNPADKVTDYFA